MEEQATLRWTRLLILLFPVLILSLLWVLDGGPVQADFLPLTFQSPLDVGVTKSVDPTGPLTVGDPITYTIAYSNAGPNLALNVVITDILPITLTNVSFFYSGAQITPTGSISYVWLIENLSPSESGLITITATVDPAFNAHYLMTNTATITTTEVDTDTRNNQSTVLSEVFPQLTTRPRLIHPPDGTFTHTTNITFTWSDESANGAYSYTLLLDGTPHTRSVPYSATVLGDGTYPWTVRALDWKGDTTGYTDTWTLTVDTVPPWIVATSPVSGEMDVGVNAAVVITFSEPIDSDQFAYAADPDPGGWAENWNGIGNVVTLTHNTFACSVDHTFTVLAANDRAANPLTDAPVTWPFSTESCQVDLWISKSATPSGPLTAGDPIIYSLTYANSGPEPALGVVITDILPITLTNVAFTYSGAQITPTGSISYTWLVEELSPGEGGAIIVTALTDPAVNEHYFLTNTVTIATTEADQNLGNNAATAVNEVHPRLTTRPHLISPPNDTITNEQTITFTWSDESANGAYSYTLLLDSTPYTVTPPYATQVLSDGLHTWTVKALDWKGNTTGYTDSWSLLIDTVPPEIQAVTPYSGEMAVGVEVPVVITFSEPIDTAAFTYTVSPDPQGWGESWNGSRTVVTLTHNPFQYWTLHTVTVLSANDLATNELVDAPVAWSFTTERFYLHLPLLVREYGHHFLYMPIMRWVSPSR